MTEVKINRTGKYWQIVCDGHAGYAEFGSDVVCAAVSTIIVSLSYYCSDPDGEKPVVLKDIITEGHADILLMGANELRYIADYVETSMRWIAETYPDFVHLTFGNIINR